MGLQLVPLNVEKLGGWNFADEIDDLFSCPASLDALGASLGVSHQVALRPTSPCGEIGVQVMATPVMKSPLFRPESQKDWEDRKETIKGLYLLENLPLKEIKEIMFTKHSFSATERMYKRQFLKWKWRKYESKGLQKSRQDGDVVEMSRGQTTCRRPPRRQSISPRQPSQHGSRLPELLLHGSPESRQTEELFFGLRDIIYGTARQDPDWARICKFDVLPKGADHLFRQFVVVSDLFEAREYANGGVILRQAFRDLEQAIEDSAVRIYQSLFLDIPSSLLSFSREQELRSYLLYLSRILKIKKRGEPITNMAKIMHRMSTASLPRLRHDLAQMYRFVADSYAQVRGESDFNTIKAKVESLCFDEEGKAQWSAGVLDSIGVLLHEAVARFGKASNEAMEIEFYLIFATQALDITSERLPGLCKTFLSNLGVETDGSWDNWSSRRLQLYAVAHWYLYGYFGRKADSEACIMCLKESIKATEQAVEKSDNETNRTIFASNLLQDRVILETLLVEKGRVEEAAAVRDAMSSSSYLQQAIESDWSESCAEEDEPAV